MCAKFTSTSGGVCVLHAWPKPTRNRDSRTAASLNNELTLSVVLWTTTPRPAARCETAGHTLAPWAETGLAEVPVAGATGNTKELASKDNAAKTSSDGANRPITAQPDFSILEAYCLHLRAPTRISRVTCALLGSASVSAGGPSSRTASG